MTIYIFSLLHNFLLLFSLNSLTHLCFLLRVCGYDVGAKNDDGFGSKYNVLKYLFPSVPYSRKNGDGNTRTQQDNYNFFSGSVCEEKKFSSLLKRGKFLSLLFFRERFFWISSQHKKVFISFTYSFVKVFLSPSYKKPYFIAFLTSSQHVFSPVSVERK